MMKALALIMGAMVLTLTVLSWAAVPEGPEEAAMELSIDGEDIVVSVDLPLDEESVVGAVPVSALPSGSVYVFHDEDWDNGSDAMSVLRLYDHLREELPLYIEDASVTLISEDGLEEVLTSGNATLVIASWDQDKLEYAAMAREWVRDGGIIIGIGAHAVPFIMDPEEAESNERSIMMEVDMDRLHHDGGEGATLTPTAEALDLAYVAPIHSIHLEDVERYGGRSIGVVYERENLTTTHAIIPMELGRVVLLGGGLSLPYLTTAEDAAAQDIERILACGTPFMEGELAFDLIGGDGSVKLPCPGQECVVFVMSLGPHVQWFSREVIYSSLLEEPIILHM